MSAPEVVRVASRWEAAVVACPVVAPRRTGRGARTVDGSRRRGPASRSAVAVPRVGPAGTSAGWWRAAADLPVTPVRWVRKETLAAPDEQAGA